MISPVEEFRTCTVLSRLAEAIRELSGDHGTAFTGRGGVSNSFRMIMIALAFAKLLTKLPNLLDNAAPYFIGIAPGIDGSVIAGKGQ